MKCKVCGNKIGRNERFCTECGAEVKPNPILNNNDDEEITLSLEDEQLITAYVTGSAETPAKQSSAVKHYLYIFSRFMRGGTVGWNWCSAFFGPYHLIYRKNYLAGFLIMLASIYLSWIGAGIPTIAFFVFGGMFFDRIQFNRYQSELENARRIFPQNFEGQRKYMARKGGVNIAVLIIAIIFGSMILTSLILLLIFLGKSISFLFTPVWKPNFHVI